MDFRELSYIDAIARTGSISRAAEELYITQPSLSHFLHQTEARYGLTLFRRVGGRYLPTDAGAACLAAAKEILERKKALDIQLARLHDPDSGTFRVGFTPMRAATLLPRVLPSFRRLYPHVRLLLREAIADVLREELGRGELDLFFCDMDPDKDNSRFSYKLLRREEILVALPPGHPAVTQALAMPDGGFAYLPLEALAGETFLLLMEQHRIGRHGRAALRRHLPQGADTLTLGSFQTVTELTSQGYGITFLYDSLLPAMGLTGRVAAFCFEERRLTTNYAAVSLPEAQPPRCAPSLIQLVEQALQGRPLQAPSPAPASRALP